MTSSWLYFDTSAYIKLFVKESGSEKARKSAKGHNLLSSAVISVECCSALARRKREGDVPEETFQKVLKEIKEGFHALEVMSVNEDILRRAEAVVLHSASRTMDAVHIASALVFQETTDIELVFVTSDARQSEAAGQSGLTVLFIE